MPFVEENDEVVHEARTSDPPTEPPAASTGDDQPLVERLHEVAAWREWLALGLGDDSDAEVDLNLDVIDEAIGEGGAA